MGTQDSEMNRHSQGPFHFPLKPLLTAELRASRSLAFGQQFINAVKSVILSKEGISHQWRKGGLVIK